MRDIATSRIVYAFHCSEIVIVPVRTLCTSTQFVLSIGVGETRPSSKIVAVRAEMGPRAVNRFHQDILRHCMELQTTHRIFNGNKIRWCFVGSMSVSHVSRRVLSRQLSSSLRNSHASSTARSVAGARRWYAADTKEERESFKGQLYQSTHERVQRERADQERFARQREEEKASQSSFSLYVPVSMYTPMIMHQAYVLLT